MSKSESKPATATKTKKVTKKVAKKAVAIELAPGITQTSKRCIYITTITGKRKYCSIERFEKLKARADGDFAKLVADYRTREGDTAEKQVNEYLDTIEELRDDGDFDTETPNELGLSTEAEVLAAFEVEG